ncbi:helix-turn-helix domain-containing protein [Arthrobacter sp. I2-34]|uniref:Helix-turn-helix domain-containing protein n=1 Tax=Arthrobacter hankyongi TaxID=2904801 RepID=A0ABS9L6Y4_9MICC|nr:helix-turn-helix domain-containing protein [Arthrobacter hankyongi]MCG2622441.1 helix-turn-helix domain-containing protein [Arthrobacter hankyongi]
MAAAVSSIQISDLTEWRRTVASLLLPLDIQTDDENFRARIDAITVNGIRLFTVSASRHWLERTRRLASAGADPFFSISVQLEGTSTISQHGHHDVLMPGDFTVYDSTVPYERRFEADSSSLVVMFPQQLINLPPKALAGIAGLRISGAEGFGAIVSAFLVGVARNLPALEGRLGLSMAASMVDLVTAAFSEKMGIVAPNRSRSRLEQMMAIRESIMAKLGDPELAPDAIAAEHFISTRQLHILFREQGTTVSTWIRERRLEMIRRDLVDPLQESESIRTLAERWGFPDATHFSRVFKETYGETPRRYRQQAQQPR